MQYQISFFSPNGSAENLACSYKQLLPSRTPMVDLRKETAVLDVSTHLIGFEFPGTSLEQIPDQIKSLLSRLENKRVLLFATSPVADDSEAYKKAETAVQSYLPSKCNYLGLYLCQGEAKTSLVEKLVLETAKAPRNKKMRDDLKLCRKSKNHPNRQDTRMACRFLVEALQLEYF